LFSWDNAKNHSNLLKHGVSFATAQLVGLLWSWSPTPGGRLIAGSSKFGSSRRVVPLNWKGKFMNKVPEVVRKELAALATRSDDDIDFSDLPATQAQDWSGAVRGKFYRPLKQQLTVRIDADVVDWLKGQGKGYQSRLNTILRSAMLKTAQER
jgi:uncharacterized protein (DUF4415 family)